MAQTIATIVNRLALPATTAANSATFPVRPGSRPFSAEMKGKRPLNFTYVRNLAAATAPGTAAPIGLFGVELPSLTAQKTVDVNGRILAGYDPGTAPLSLDGISPAGAYVEQVRVTGGAGTGFGPVVILNPGRGYDPASPPTVTITGGGSAAGTAIVSPDGRVVGVLLTNAGTYAAAATISIAAPTAGVTATAALSAGQVTTVQTHIPFAAHAPQTAGGAYWLAVWRGRVIACSTQLLGTTQGQPTAAQLGVQGLEPDAAVVGLNTAPGFTVATGTHSDGTTTIGVLTLGVGIPNGDTITVIRGVVRNLVPVATGNGVSTVDLVGTDIVYLAGNATAGATETSVITAAIRAAGMQ